MLLFLSACNTPNFSGKTVKKEYFTGGQIRSEFIMDDESGQNGLLKKYGYSGHVISASQIRNGVPHGTEIGYDEQGRVLWKKPYKNGKIDGIYKEYYQNGDVMASHTYENGVKNGLAQTYSKDGSIHRRVIFRNNKIVN